MLPEPCAVCSFAAADYDNRDDLFGTARSLIHIWRTMVEHLDPRVVAPIAATGEAIAAFDQTLPQLMKDPAPDTDALIATMHSHVHALHDAGRAIYAAGAGAPHQRGTLAQINTSGGGVPKRPCLSATVSRRALAGDVQAERRHHGKPLQAVSLWSEEVIAALAAEGHPIYPGAAGENLTLRAVAWDTIRPGVHMAVGNKVLLEISGYAVPCTKNAQWFADRDFRRIDHDRHPGWSRAYAWVLAGGAIAPGDEVVVEP